MMRDRKQLVPAAFESLVREEAVPGMPGEHAFRFSLRYMKDGSEREWQRVWIVTDLATEFADVDTAADPLETLQSERERQRHKFKIDIIRYLKRTHQRLMLDGDSLILSGQD